MTTLYTSSYRAFVPGSCVPVITSLGLPRWRPEAADWPRCWVLTPTAAILRMAEGDWQSAYLEQLSRHGPEKIARSLHAIAREHGAERVVLLCHELVPEQCHRRLWAAYWLSVVGEIVEEL